MTENTFGKDVVAFAEHDLGRLFTLAHGWLEIAKDSLSNSEDLLTGVHIERSSAVLDRIERLVSGLLQIGSAGSKGEQPLAQTFSPAEAAYDVVLSLIPEAQQRSVVLLTKLETTNEKISGDRDIYWRAVFNVVQNAIQYTPRGGAVSIHVRTEAGYTVVEVIDSGIGIDQQELASVFTPYSRGKSAKLCHPGGRGLGLSIAAAAVRACKGTLGIASRPGSGTAVKIVLPRVKRLSQEGEGDDAAERGEDRTSAVKHGQKRRAQLTLVKKRANISKCFDVTKRGCYPAVTRSS